MTVKAQICCNRAAETSFQGNDGTRWARGRRAVEAIGAVHAKVQAAG